MRFFRALFAALLLTVPSALRAQPQLSGNALQSSNILNPNISAVGWLQGEAGRRKPVVEEAAAPFAVKEAEIAFQSVIDPYTRADVFVAVEGEGGIELEEGHLTWYSLPGGLSLKAGKFKGAFGKFNLTHRPETAFADRPLSHEAYLGEEGLASAGGGLSWHIPNPWLLVNLDAQAFVLPGADEVPAFGKAKRNDLLYIGRLGGYYDLTESANITLGGSCAFGAAGREFNPVTASSSTLSSRLYSLDLTYRWKNPRRAIYRSLFWQTELLWNRREITAGSYENTMGYFSHLEYQFARRWRAGGRYDWTRAPGDGTAHESGGLVYLTFMPSEFSRISLQGRQVDRSGGTKEKLGFLKLTFNIGPHGVHLF
ncbi:MAG: hypothetical protein HY796_00360 [Elusimicrobia bacterium]|nr:hypothetical protein [Elusimicrobiota bacterium]